MALCRACVPASERIERCWQMKTHCAWSSHSVGVLFNIDTHQLCPTLRMECHYPPAALVCVCVCCAACARLECDADRPFFDEVVLWSWAGTQQCTWQAYQRRPTAPFINYSKTLQQRLDLILLPHLAQFISHMCTLYCRSSFANELTTCRWFKL